MGKKAKTVFAVEPVETIPVEGLAVQVNLDGIRELQQWLEAHTIELFFDMDGVSHMRIYISDGANLTPKEGDWIIKDASGYKLLSNEEYRRIYRSKFAYAG